MAGESKTKPAETGRALTVRRIMEKISRWRSESYEAQIEDTVDRLMMVDVWLMWYLLELEDFKRRLLEDSLLKQLTSIIDALINQVWSLLQRWIKVKTEVIKDIRELKKRRKRNKIKGRGYTIKIKHSKYVSDVVVTLWGSETSPVDVPRIIPEEISKILKIGWYASDASRKEMTTHQFWQTLSWLVLYKKVHIYVEGISITMDDVKVIWRIYVDSDDIKTDDAAYNKLFAYKQMLKLPKDQFALSLFTALLGDGSSRIFGGHREIKLVSGNRDILEAIAQKIKDEFDISGSITPANESTWRYTVTGPEAQKLAKFIINNVIKNVPVLRRVYDILADYELIGFRKWLHINRSSIYIYNQRKVEFGGFTWSVHFKNNYIFLSMETSDIGYAEEVLERMRTQGINAVLTRYTTKKDNKTHYEIIIPWSVLQRYLCDQKLRTQLIETTTKSIESCEIRKKINCYAKQWLEKLTNLRCQDPAQRGPGPINNQSKVSIFT